MDNLTAKELGEMFIRKIEEGMGEIANDMIYGHVFGSGIKHTLVIKRKVYVMWALLFLLEFE